MTIEPNFALAILTAVALVTIWVMDRIARSNSLAREAISRIDTHERVCTERQRRIEEHLEAISHQVQTLGERRGHQRS